MWVTINRATFVSLSCGHPARALFAQSLELLRHNNIYAREQWRFGRDDDLWDCNKTCWRSYCRSINARLNETLEELLSIDQCAFVWLIRARECNETSCAWMRQLLLSLYTYGATTGRLIHVPATLAPRRKTLVGLSRSRRTVESIIYSLRFLICHQSVLLLFRVSNETIHFFSIETNNNCNFYWRIEIIHHSFGYLYDEYEIK